ncbi:MAG: MFS transporter [Chloroflexota bacterium]|nr:MFS transporter [Chloroflexota bacterium]
MSEPVNREPTELDTRRVIPIFLMVFVDMLGLTLVLPLLHLYAAAYGAGPLEVGVVVAAFPLAQLIGVPMMGALSDRYGRRPLLLISQVTTCISFIMLGLANSLALIIVSRLFDGLFGANIATAQAALSDITDASNRARGLGMTGAAFGLGFIFGPAIAILSFELTDSLAAPAFTAALYSFLSILITTFMFKETHPPGRRGRASSNGITPVTLFRYLARPFVGFLLLLMFAQQFIFFGFESLLGLFTLTRLGFLGAGNAALFLFVGIILVFVQMRAIGPWSSRFGEGRLVMAALFLLALGLLLAGATPEQPHPFYVRELVARDLMAQAPTRAQALIGDLRVELPANGNNGLAGVLWLALALIPISVGAALIRPALNSLITRSVGENEYGSALGLSSALVSAANASAPLVAALLFQQLGASAPFAIGGALMVVLCLSSLSLSKWGPRGM